MTPLHVPDGSGERLVFPGAIELTILIPGPATNGAFSLFEDIVQPDIGPPRHIHHAQDELFFVLEGAFDIEIAGQLHHARPGDIAFVPKGQVHAFKNVASSPGRLRYMFSPAGNTETMFRKFFEAAQTGQLSVDAMATIAEQFEQEFVGPPL